MNMGGLERQLMSSFKDMEAKEKEKEQKASCSIADKRAGCTMRKR